MTNYQTRPQLVIMAKTPRLGTVKTRLARDIGFVAATRFYRHLTARLLHQLARDPRWQTHLALSPDIAISHPFWREQRAGTLSIIPQGTGSLGQRMQAVFAAFAPAPTLIIGSDIPGITNAHIAAALKMLGNHQVVFGPSGDGGYWCVGQRNRPSCLGMFRNVRWSGPHALDDSINNLPPASYGLTTELKDIDTGADFAAHPPGATSRWLLR